MKEVHESKKYNTKYVIITDGYVTSDNVLIKKTENGLTPEQYEERKKGPVLYDFYFAKSTGYLRRIRGTAHKEEEKKEEVKEKEKLVIKQKFTSPFKIASFFISLVAMGASTYFTTEFLSQSGYFIVLAVALSLSMVTFTTMAFEAIVMFKRKKQYLFMLMFIVLWPVVLVFSMVSTIIVNYGMYEATAVVNTAEVEVSRYQQLISINEQKIEQQQVVIDNKRETIAYYEEREWGTLTVQRELQAELDELQLLYDEQSELLNSEIDSTIETEIVEEDFYTFFGKLIGRDPGTVSFIISILPAIFIDIIAPLSMAVAIFL